MYYTDRNSDFTKKSGDSIEKSNEIQNNFAKYTFSEVICIKKEETG